MDYVNKMTPCIFARRH